MSWPINPSTKFVNGHYPQPENDEDKVAVNTHVYKSARTNTVYTYEIPEEKETTSDDSWWTGVKKAGWRTAEAMEQTGLGAPGWDEGKKEDGVQIMTREGICNIV